LLRRIRPNGLVGPTQVLASENFWDGVLFKGWQVTSGHAGPDRLDLALTADSRSFALPDPELSEEGPLVSGATWGTLAGASAGLLGWWLATDEGSRGYIKLGWIGMVGGGTALGGVLGSSREETGWIVAGAAAGAVAASLLFVEESSVTHARIGLAWLITVAGALNGLAIGEP